MDREERPPHASILRSLFKSVASLPSSRLLASLSGALADVLARLEERYGSNVVYGKVIAMFLLLLLTLRAPWVFSLMTIAVVLLQNSTTDSLNQLVVFFFDSGLFTNFSEAAACARLVTWLSVLCTIIAHVVYGGGSSRPPSSFAAP